MVSKAYFLNWCRESSLEPDPSLSGLRGDAVESLGTAEGGTEWIMPPYPEQGVRREPASILRRIRGFERGAEL